MRPRSDARFDTRSADGGTAPGRVSAGARRARRTVARVAVPRALGRAVAPRRAMLVLPSGTHRTRVSEMRLAGAHAAAPRPDLVGAGQAGTQRATGRGGTGVVRPGTG